MNTKLFLSMFMLIGLLFGAQNASAVVKTSIPAQKSGYYLDVKPEELLNKSVRSLHKESAKILHIQRTLST